MSRRSILLGVLVVIGIVFIVVSQLGRDPSIRKAIVGLEAPGFTVMDRDGTEIALSQFKGKTVFIHFWATWCKECREEMPGIQALYNRKKKDADFVFVSVIYKEDPIVTNKWLKENNYDIPTYVDPGGKAARTYGVTAVPETFIVDNEGMLTKRILGPWDWEKI